MIDLIVLIVKLLIGIVICFAGYRLRKTLLPLIWFVICFELSSKYVGMVFTDPKIALLITILIGLIGAFFSYNLEKITIHILGFYAGFSVFTSIFGNASLIGIVGGIIIGIIFACLAVKLYKIIIIASTSWIGASMIVPLVINYITLPFESIYLIVILFVLGFIIQFFTSGKSS